MRTVGALMQSPNSLSIKATPPGASILGVPIETLRTNKSKIDDNVHDFTPEIHEALSSIEYTGNKMEEDSDFFNVRLYFKRCWIYW